MSLTRRLILVAGLISLGAACNVLLLNHLSAGKGGEFPELRGHLADLPVELHVTRDPNQDSATIVWQGREHPGREAVVKQVPFADEVLYRAYLNKERATTALVYAAYSRTGEDRKHHPEICMREAAGVPEDLQARAKVPLSTEGRQAQRFRFSVGTGRTLNLYYWHYTFPAVLTARESRLQSLHRLLCTAPPSITVQVSTYAAGADLEAVEKSLLPALDLAMSERLLPERTRVGCDRIPITMIRR